MMAAPDLIQPVLGFRSWRVVGDHISSPYVPLRWDEPVVTARCYPANRSLLFGRGWLDEPHDAPHPDCKCGIYAWHEPPSRNPVWHLGEAFGVVSLWGRIEVHSDGMRAEFARVEALSYHRELGGTHRREIETAASSLGVAAIPYDAVVDYARKLGGGVPETLRPAA